MEPSQIKKIGSFFKEPVIPAGSLQNFNKPIQKSVPVNFPSPTARPVQVNKPVSVVKKQNTNPVKKDFSLVDFSKNKVIKNDIIYKSNFRDKTRRALEGTLKHSKDRNTVANILWDSRGNGLYSDEIKYKLRNAEKQKKLSSDQVRAVRRKIGIN